MPISVFGRHNVLTRIVFAATQWIGLSDVLLASQSFRDRFECRKRDALPDVTLGKLVIGIAHQPDWLAEAPHQRQANEVNRWNSFEVYGVTRKSSG